MVFENKINQREIEDAAWHVWLLYEAGNLAKGDKVRHQYVDYFRYRDPQFNAVAFNADCRTP